MKPAVCKSCGRAEWNHLCGVVPERPSRRCAIPRRTDREAPDKTLPDVLPGTRRALPTSTVPTPDTSDTEPSVTNSASSVNNISLLTDDDLRPYYNEWMRRKMARHRSG
jgi:hypothetical protein